METGVPGEVTPVIVILDHKSGHGCAIVPLPAMEATFVLVIHQSLLIVPVLVI